MELSDWSESCSQLHRWARCSGWKPDWREEDTSNHPHRTDADLLDAAARAGVPEAFGELYDRYAAAAYGWARKAGLDEADALDLVAELFASAWVSRKRFRPPPSATS